MPDLLSEVVILQVACKVWTDFLGVVALPKPDAPPLRGAILTGMVRFHGETDGGVALSMSREHARTLAAGVFLLKPEDVSDADLKDLMGELASIVAGNIKAASLLVSTLALPVVHDGAVADDALGHSGGHFVRAVISSDGQPVLLRVFAG